MNNSCAHQQLVNQILLAVGSLPYARVWIRCVGFDSARKLKYGIKGEADIDGILMGGRRLAIEVKTGDAKLSLEQKRWRAMIEKFGGLYIEARSVEQVLKEIETYIKTII